MFLLCNYQLFIYHFKQKPSVQKIPFRPAPGYRNRDTGLLWSTGSNGHSWTAQTNDTYSLHLSFSMQYLLSSYAYYRGHGLQLRCLSE
ncbi:hypothetical protein [uncultured Rikenella sp.]|uniref:hypothetical protein n=1 Tax=uncultured Rikenella sp. TaxID=368003 RepID=UPI00272C5D77|nr:hypothetical protein [uncultured Rikenella sp.]